MITAVAQFLAGVLLGAGLSLAVRSWWLTRQQSEVVLVPASDARARCLLCLTDIPVDLHQMRLHSWQFHNGPQPGMALAKAQPRVSKEDSR